MKTLAGLEVAGKSVEWIAEAIGADIAAGERPEIGKSVQLDLPVIVGEPIPILYVQVDWHGSTGPKKETLGRKGKTDGQPGDPDSTTCTGAIETAEEFGKRIYLEAWNCGWSRAAKKVVMGDGAEWIWNLADQHFPGAVQIVDLYVATVQTR